jgi:transcription elongation GreA/GreB family factor
MAVKKKGKTIDKPAIVQAIVADLADKEATIRAAAAAATENATHEQSKPENDKDTRALEASYLAGGYAARARDLKAMQRAVELMELKTFDDDEPIEASAIVELERDDKRELYFLALHGGGLKVKLGKRTLTVITPESPLGAALLEKRVGDDVELNRTTFEIVAVQ